MASWAKRFLFRPEQLELPVGRLSGGEQARILIARLMREPADLLILDEPTNDLDIPTLEVLEDSLAEFDGGLVLVTHDRFMLERVSTRHPGPRRRGRRRDVRRLRAVGGGPRPPGAPAPRETPPSVRRRARARGPSASATSSSASGTGWSRRSWMPRRAVEACRRAAEDPAIASDPAALQTRYAALEAARAEVDRLYARWAELEAKQPDG